MSDIKISQLPYIGKTGYTATDIIPFVNYINPTGTTSETKIDELRDYILENSFSVKFSYNPKTSNRCSSEISFRLLPNDFFIGL